jgi:protein-disulfide isomerase
MASKSQRSRAERTAALMQEQSRKERQRKIGLVAAIVALLALVVGLGFWVQSQRDTSGEAASSVPSGLTGDYTVVVGDDSADTTIGIYEDFQCPVCKEFEAAVGDQLDQATADGTAKVEYHLVAFLDGASTTDYSSRALNAAMVVLDTAGVDTFMEYRRTLFENQPAEGTAGLTDDELIDLAVQSGADQAAIEGPIKDNKFHQWVVNATDQMSKDGVNGTPSVFVDGEFAGNSPQDGIDAILNAIQ